MLIPQSMRSGMQKKIERERERGGGERMNESAICARYLHKVE